MVVTEELQSDLYTTLSLEDAQKAEQNRDWEKSTGASIGVDGVRTARPGTMGTTTANGSFALLTRRSTGSIGAAKLLKVMSGDKIHTRVDYFYQGPDASATNNGTTALSSAVSALVSSLSAGTAATGIVKGGTSTINSNLTGNTALSTLLNTAPTNNGAPGLQAPKAYLCILFFDERMQFDATASRVLPVAYTPGVLRQLSQIGSSGALTAPKNGYAYVYVTNESDELVYWDNFMLTHERGPILEETHYYPFGLTMAGISSMAAGGLENKKEKFQGQPLDDELGLNWYGFKWRNHDPQIGRFIQIDPLSENFYYNSTYAFAENRVINGVELEGLEWENFMSKFKKPSELKVKTPSGNGVQHQNYMVVIQNPKKALEDLRKTFKDRPQDVLSNSKADFQPIDENGKKLDKANLSKGSFLDILIDGPMNDSKVKVSDEKNTENGFSYTFVTLEGHVEAGQITFSASQGKEGNLVFTIDSKSKVDFGLVPDKFARDQQKKSWVEVLDNIVKFSQGKEKGRKVTTEEEKN